MTEKDMIDVASGHPLLGRIERDVLRSMVRVSQVITYRPKRTFVREGDPPEQVFFVLRGAVRIYHRAEDGSEVLLRLLGAPVMFGDMEVMANQPFLEYATTLEPCQILRVPARVFLRLLSDEPDFARAVAFDASLRLCLAAQSLKVAAFCDVETRLANLLLDYVQLAGEMQPGGIRIPLALSQLTMARDLAASRKAVAEALQKLRKGAVLTKERGHYLVRDLQALRARRCGSLSLSFRSGHPISTR